MDKALFLKNDLVAHIRSVPEDTKGLWGKMNLQQMTEHMSNEGFRWASGKIPHTLHTPEEHIPKMQEFLRSEKMFRENTVNALMPEEPLPLRNTGMPEALEELQAEIDYFFTVYEQEPDKKVLGPFFGELNYELWILLLYKHSLHHLKQFGVNI